MSPHFSKFALLLLVGVSFVGAGAAIAQDQALPPGLESQPNAQVPSDSSLGDPSAPPPAAESAPEGELSDADIQAALEENAAISATKDTASDTPADPTESMPVLPGLPEDSALPTGPSQAFSFDDENFNFEQSPEEAKESARKEAYDAALQGLLPLRPDEIRTLIERYDRTQESVETPIYPSPKPDVVVENISLDPGARPGVVKMAFGHVTTVTFLDVSGAPWPVQDISWAGNFEVIENTNKNEQGGYTHMFRISPQSEFAYGNMSVTLIGLQTPVIITLETNRETVYYRYDAIIPDYGPLAEAPLISSGITTIAGSPALSSALEGVMPPGSKRLSVTGVDGRTSAYEVGKNVYVRTPLTLLSPGWSHSVASADGTRVYEITKAPVLLLSDRGRMVRAKLSDREDLSEKEGLR